MNFTYSLYSQSEEILETESLKHAIETAKIVATDRKAAVSIFENDETTGDQRFVMWIEPKE
jgi:hypothetical protein